MPNADAASRSTGADRALIEQRVRRILELRADGDIAGMLEFVAPDIVYTGGTWRRFPMQGRHEGRRAVGDMVRQMNILFENLGSTINKLLIDGDRVAVHRTSTIRNRGAGAAVAVEIWNFVRFRDGLVVEFSEYPDTQAFASLGEPAG